MEMGNMSERQSLALFSGTAILLFIALMLGAAYKQGWFEPSMDLVAEFEGADGLRVGTSVVLMGLKIGSVSSVDLEESGKISIRLSVLKRYAPNLNSSVIAKSGRTFVIGEKIITLTVTSKNAQPLNPSVPIRGEETLELVDLLSGGRMSPYFNTFAKLLEQLQLVIEGSGEKDSVKLIDLYKQAYRTLKSVEMMGDDVRIMRRDVFATPETKALFMQLSEATRNLTKVMNAMETTLPRVGDASQEISRIVPELNSTLKETQFTFQALQKSFLLRGGVRELKEEKAEATPKEANRIPATISAPLVTPMMSPMLTPITPNVPTVNQP